MPTKPLAQPQRTQSAEEWLAARGLADLRLHWPVSKPKSSRPQLMSLTGLMEAYAHSLKQAAVPTEPIDDPSKEELKAECEMLREELSPVPPQPTTRFDDFDDDAHPFREWWNKCGQFMLSGGGRRESIWAARGWIAREQLAHGVAVTGDSMHEAAVPERDPATKKE